MKNIPEVKLGLVAVSRDCFVITLSERRRHDLAEAFRAAGGEIEEICRRPWRRPTKRA